MLLSLCRWRAQCLETQSNLQWAGKDVMTRPPLWCDNSTIIWHHVKSCSTCCCQNSAYCPSPATRQTCSHTTRPVSSSSTSIAREARLETWHQVLADAVFSHRQHSFPGRVIAECLRTAGRHVSTWLGYAGKVKQWEDFCARTGVAPFPAQQAYLLCYLGHIQEEGTVKASSLQPYLSTLNSWHADMGLPKPAVGQAITMLSSRYCEVQDDEDD